MLSMHTDYVWTSHWFVNTLFVFLLVHRLLTTFTDLRFYFAAPTQRFSVFTQWFPSTWFFDWCWCHRHIRTDICDFPLIPHHSSIYNILEVLLVVTLVYMLTYIFLCYDGVQPKMSPTISFSGMYQKSFIYLRNRTNSQ